jgi:hypothetical protein
LAEARHALSYVVPLQPQTGSYTSEQTDGRATHSPGSSHETSEAQYSDRMQSSLLSHAHAPSLAIETPAAAASHPLPYVSPSQPQTGMKTSVQFTGRATHSPGAAHSSRLQ